MRLLGIGVRFVDLRDGQPFHHWICLNEKLEFRWMKSLQHIPVIVDSQIERLI